jgi:glyoxylase-like metal-dependent hydrolase (beta-lactamase superfamily II)
MEVRFFNGGHCRQLLALIDRRSWRWVKFHAVFMAVHHPREGWVLIDTGYGERFQEATRSWPQRLYRWATPATMAGTARETIRRSGIDPSTIKHVIITHFHADHVGGLAEFPHATIHYHADAWRSLAGLKPFRQVHSAFLSALVPEWLPTSSHAIEAAAFAPSTELPFPVHDLFGDGLIKLVYLPGHAPGHLGIFLPETEGSLLYATDAYWNLAQIDRSVDLIAPVLRLQWDGKAYQHTVRQLRDVARAGKHQLLACHAPETQALIFQPVAKS